MIKKLISSIIATLSIISCSIIGMAAELDIGEIAFVNAKGDVIKEYSNTPITAKVSCDNNSTGLKSPALIVCEYKENMLTGIWYNTEDIEEGRGKDVSVTFTPTHSSGENVKIKAVLVDGMKTLNNYTRTAEFLNDSTALREIKVNGVELKEYDDNCDIYKMKYSEDIKEITAIAADGGTNIQTSLPDKLPGVADIKVTSAYGTERDIKLILYKEEKDLYSLRTFAYYIDGQRYEVEGFDPGVNEYEITLPDNTFYVTMEGTVFDVPDITKTMKVRNINSKNKVFGENEVVYNSQMGISETANVPCINGVVPIKNEATKGVVTVAYGEEKQEYIFKFISKQPRLTEFTLVGAENDTTKPMFVGGAALNNDCNTWVGTDRSQWVYTNISDALIGCSMFAMDIADNRFANKNTWWKNNSSGAYFTFKADTAGTIYVINSQGFKNSEYTENGYVSSSTSLSMPSGYTDWKAVPKTWNGYGSDKIALVKCQWNGYTQQFDESVWAKASEVQASYLLNRIMKKEFEAGELVTVYHTGNYPTSSAQTNGIQNTAVIKWKLDE